MITQQQLDTFIKKRPLADQLGLSVSTLDRMVKAKRFPAPVPISLNRIGFRVSEIQDWQANPKAWAAKHERAA
jgi:predicted DNA-binding transcriptional regulator AlpA